MTAIQVGYVKVVVGDQHSQRTVYDSILTAKVCKIIYINTINLLLPCNVCLSLYSHLVGGVAGSASPLQLPASQEVEAAICTVTDAKTSCHMLQWNSTDEARFLRTAGCLYAGGGAHTWNVFAHAAAPATFAPAAAVLALPPKQRRSLSRLGRHHVPAHTAHLQRQ
jgi:hypothetical protein